MVLVLSKAEMEDIWQNKSVGYFQNLKKTLKKSKRYKVMLEPYSIIRHEVIVKEVIASDKQSAVWQVKNEAGKIVRERGIDVHSYYERVFEI